jgi:hypothetical protein
MLSSDSVTLADLRQSRHLNEAICKACGGLQPIDLLAVAVAHGELALLGLVGEKIPCMFWDAISMLPREITHLN